MRYTIAFVTLAASVFSGSAFAQGESIYVPDLDCVGGRFGLKLPSDVRAVKRLAPLVRQELVEVQNWPGYKTTRNLLHFDGLTLEVIEFSNDPARYHLTFASVASPAWNAISAVKIAQPIESAAAVLGSYASQNPGLARSFEDEGNMLTIRSDQGVVSEVTYQCYPG
jgi:hypothetical protein